MAFLPITIEEMKERGWDRPDFVYICGDAYVDHPSFGAAIICRTLESYGYKVCFVGQPDWNKKDDFMRFGEPRLAFLVSAGNIDSMVNHYSVAKKRRTKDYYSPGGQMGLRPDRATIVYCNKIRKLMEILSKSAHINFIGLHFHIGSQITRVDEVFALECKRVNEIVAYFERNGLKINNINLGGGLGVDYDDPDGSPIADFETWFRTISENIVRRPDQSVHVEPGRSLVAQCATLISRVLFVKSGETKNFLIMDAGMNDLIRPALYGAYHKIENLSAQMRTFFPTHQAYDIVGPVCESSDVWGAGRLLPLSVRGDLMAIRSTGAYGQVMASRYNMKDLAPSVFSDRLDDAPQMTDYFG